MTTAIWVNGPRTEAEAWAAEQYKAAYHLRRVFDVDRMCAAQMWAHAFGTCEALASRDPGRRMI